ncbi:MAG TPA: terminase family protein [Armatimonadota bacterium]|nr:terminase family protein [Armatimonadota bacterium]
MTIQIQKRIDLARTLWDWEPHPTQREWLLDEHPVKVAACGRRWGKTEAAAIDVATYAIANNGSVQMIVAPTYDQSRLISDTIERLLLMKAEIRKHAKVTKTPYPDIRYKRSRIMARTADEDGRNLRGHSADRVIVDEAAFVRDRVIEEVIGPMLADRDGQLVMVSTPFGRNHFYRAFVQGQADGEMGRWGDGATGRTRSFRFPSIANPHISREYIEHQREILSERQFKVEYEAEFADDQNSVFAWADIQEAIEDAGTRGHGDAGIRVAGIDWARYSDYTAVIVLETATLTMDPGPSTIPFRVVCLDKFNKMDWHSQVERVADLLCRHRVSAVLADQTSVGDPVLEILRNTLWGERHLDAEIEGMVFTNQSKRELIDNLAIRLAHRDVSFPYHEQLVRELQFYEYELTESGNVKTGARRGYHDDCVIALALALRIAARYQYASGFTTSGHIRQSARGW